MSVLPQLDGPDAQDLRISDHVNALLLFHDAKVAHEYGDFAHRSQSFTPLLIVNVFLVILLVPCWVLYFLHNHESSRMAKSGGWAAYLIILTAISVAILAVYILSGGNFSKHKLVALKTTVFMLLTALVCYRTIARVAAGQCPDPGISNTWDCNPAAEVRALPMDSAFMCFLLPVLYVVSVKGTQIQWSSLMIAASTVTLVACALMVRSAETATYIVVTMCGSLFILIETRKQNLQAFFMFRKLQLNVKLREQAFDEANATEMRHMIANVAHDLKTPLASFVGGIEYISDVIHELRGKQLEAESAHDTGLMVRPTLWSEAEECVQQMAHCIVNMRNTNAFMLMTINRCIDYTKASKGVALVPKYETIDLLETLTLPMHCMKDIQQRIAISLLPLPADICSHVITDKQWLQENVLCLLSNAVKYSNEGAVTVSVGLENTLEDQADTLIPLPKRTSTERLMDRYTNAPTDLGLPLAQVLRVEVEDTGIGLSDEAMASLFSPFKQAQRLAGGTGLGLFSLAKRIEALGGRCGVERRRDGREGSLFWFSIPYRPDSQTSRLQGFISPTNKTTVAVLAQNASEKRRASRPGSFADMSDRVTPTARDGRGSAFLYPTPAPGFAETRNAEPVGHAMVGVGELCLDVLVVDDSPAILKMTAMILRRCKHRVTTATNGAEALKVIGEHLEQTGQPFDVVLMDLQMPVMDGLEATRRLRALEEPRASSILAGSSFSQSKSTHLACALSSVTEVGMSLPACLSFEESVRTTTRPRIVIIGMSANSDPTTAAEAYRMGVDSFMPKPFSLDAFVATYLEITARAAASVA